MERVVKLLLVLMLVNLTVSSSKINETTNTSNMSVVNYDELNFTGGVAGRQNEIIENEFGVYVKGDNNGTIRNETLPFENETLFVNGDVNSSLGIKEGIFTSDENETIRQNEFKEVIKVNESEVLNKTSVMEGNVNNELLSSINNNEDLILKINETGYDNQTMMNVENVMPIINKTSFRKENEIIANETNSNKTDFNYTYPSINSVHNNSMNTIINSTKEETITTNLTFSNLTHSLPINQTNNTQQEILLLRNQSSTVNEVNNITENETLILNNTNPQSSISIPEIHLTNNPITKSNETLNTSVINNNYTSSSSSKNNDTISLTNSDSSRLTSSHESSPPINITEVNNPVNISSPHTETQTPRNTNLNISVNTPEIVIPQTNSPNITITEPQVPSIEIPTIEVTPVNSSSISIPEITVPNININIPTIPTQTPPLSTSSLPINQQPGTQTGSNSVSISQAEANNYKVLTETLSDYELLLTSTTQPFIPVISSSSLTDQVLSPDHLNALAQLHSELSSNMYTLPQHHLQDILDLQASITPIYPTILGTQCIPMYWQDTKILANDISIGPQGDIYVAAVDGHLYQYDLIRNKYTKIKGDFDLGSISKVSVSNDGTVYVVTASGSTYYLNMANKWILLPGCASDIAVGNGGEVYKIGCDIRTNGYGVFRLFNNENNEESYKQHKRCRRKKNNNCEDCSYIYENNNNNKVNKPYWFRLSGSGVRIAVSPSGLPYIVNSSGMILSYENENWTPIITAGLARDIEVSNDGEIFYIDYYYNIFRVLNRKGNVYQMCGIAKTLSAGPFSQPFIIGKDHKVYTASRFMFE